MHKDIHHQCVNSSNWLEGGYSGQQSGPGSHQLQSAPRKEPGKSNGERGERLRTSRLEKQKTPHCRQKMCVPRSYFLMLAIVGMWKGLKTAESSGIVGNVLPW